MTNRILLALDGSAMDEAALAEVRRVAAGGAEIHLIHAVPSRAVPVGSPLLGMVESPEFRPEPVGATGASAHVRGSFPPSRAGHDSGEESRIYRGAVQYLERCRRELRGIRGQDILQTGAPAQAILEAALAFNIDLIVMSTRARSGFAWWLLGSISRTVLRRSGLPVLLVRRGIQPPVRELRRVLVATDGSDESRAVLPAVESIAARTRAEVVLLHVAAGKPSAKDPPEWLQATASRFAEAGVSLRTTNVEGRLVSQVLSRAASEDVDLIALSLRGRKRAELLSKADRPILLQEPSACSG